MTSEYMLTSLIFSEYQKFWWNKSVLVKIAWLVFGLVIGLVVFDIDKLRNFFEFLRSNLWADAMFRIVFAAYLTYLALIFLLNMLTPSRSGLILARYFTVFFMVLTSVFVVLQFYA